MTLFSDPTCPYCHRVRMVLAEKKISVDIVDVDAQNLPDEVADANPYATVPTLVDRDLRLYESQIIMEYMDERFPHPPLLPVDPVARANARMFMYRIDRDWYSLMRDIIRGSDADAATARAALRESLSRDRATVRCEQVLHERRVLVGRLLHRAVAVAFAGAWCRVAWVRHQRHSVRHPYF